MSAARILAAYRAAFVALSGRPALTTPAGGTGSGFAQFERR